MAIRHWSGRGIAGEEIKPGVPPPAAPAPMPAVPVPPVTVVTHARVPEPEAPDVVTNITGFTVTCAWDGNEVVGVGTTLQAAMADAQLRYEAAQPIQPLIWSDGSPVEGLARQVLVEALETYSQYAGEKAPAEIILMVGRLFASLGETR